MTDLLLAIIILVALVTLWAIWRTKVKELVEEGTYRIIAQLIATVFVVLVGIYTGLNVNNPSVGPGDWVRTNLYVGLVGITAFYTFATYQMAKEMKAQGRPLVIQRAIHKSPNEIRSFGSTLYFMYFEIYNEGKGPALELEIYLVDKDRQLLQSFRETLFRVNTNPVRIHFDGLETRPEHEKHYCICQYRGIQSDSIWYRSELPFEVVQSVNPGNIYIKPFEIKLYQSSKKESY